MADTAKSTVFSIDESKSLTGWIARLFMIGSSLFFAGSILFLLGGSTPFFNGMVFFIGSLFFTSAAYCQYYQSINPHEVHQYWFTWQVKNLTFYVACTQFIGTILFNVNTLDALLDLGWFGQELLVWCPDIIGSILFQISGCLSVIAMNRCGVNSSTRGVSWYIGIANFSGCVAFLISACFALVLPHPVDVLSIYSTIFTLIGALCFFVSAYLMWSELRLTANY